MLNFILGGPGTGKSRQCIERLHAAFDAEASAGIYLIVPEQFSFESDRMVYEALGSAGYNSVKVLSFTSLSEEIFSTCGGVAGEYADEAAKLVLMSLTLSELRDALDVYTVHGDSLSLCSSMLETVEELKTAGLSAAAFALGTEELPGALGEKSREIALVYETYQALLERGYKDNADDLVRAGKLALAKDYFRGSTVFIDEFKSFTGDEQPLLRAILSQAAEVYVCLCTEEVCAGAHSLFSVVNETYRRLCRLAEEESIPVRTAATLAEPHRFRSGELKHLSANLFRPRMEKWTEEAPTIRVVEAADPYQEADYLCAQIAHLVRQNGYTYGEIAVAGRQLAPYAPILESAFEKYEIPYFMDRREQILHKPLLLAVLSALEAAGGFSTEALLRYAKTGLAGLSLTDAARLENYCYTWDIRGGLWREDFTAPPDGGDEKELERINAARRVLIEPLLRFRTLTEEATGGVAARALFDLLEQTGVPELVGKRIAQAFERGDVAEAHEWRQLWDLLVESLDLLHHALAEVAVTRMRFGELLRMVLAATKFALPPQTKDAVTVGSADRMRMAAPRAVFVIGATEGVFPFVPKSGGLYSDKEREALLACGIELPGARGERLAEERFIAYKTLCAPSERLYLTYPLASSAGSGLLPSTMLRDISAMFDGVKLFTAQLPSLFFCTSLRAAYQTLAGGFHEDNAERASLFSVLSEREELKGKLRFLGHAAEQGAHRLYDQTLAVRLFGKSMTLSATKLEKYHLCAFRYYCGEGLRLRAPARRELGVLERGNVIHYCLFRLLSSQDFDAFLQMDDDAFLILAKRLLTEYLEQELGGDFAKTERFRYQYGRLARQLVELFKRLRDEFAQSAFRPCGFEAPIDEGSEIPPLELATPDGSRIRVVGKIDRVDRMERNGKSYIRVVDYKTGKRVFSLSDVYYGLNMQMLLYLFAIWKNGKGKYAHAVPAGILYMPSGESVPSLGRETAPEDADSERRKGYCMNGLLLDDPEVLSGMEPDGAGLFIPVRGDGKRDAASLIALEELGRLSAHAERLMSRMVADLHTGHVEALPVSNGGTLPCSYCEYATVCGNAGRLCKPLVAIGREEVWERLREEEEHGEKLDG